MKTLGINGSPRRKKSHTLKLVDAVLDGVQDCGAETELVDIGALAYGVAWGVWYVTPKASAFRLTISLTCGIK